jgi:hypothetical protein
MTEKDTYKYHLKKGYRTIERGITSDLLRKEAEYREIDPNFRVKQVGRRTSMREAMIWLHKGGKRPYKHIKRRVNTKKE